MTSNFRNSQSLTDYLKSNNIVGIADIDTRRLTRVLRTTGSQNGCIIAGDDLSENALAEAKAFPGLKGMDLAKVVSTKESFEWNHGS